MFSVAVPLTARVMVWSVWKGAGVLMVTVAVPPFSAMVPLFTEIDSLGMVYVDETRAAAVLPLPATSVATFAATSTVTAPSAAGVISAV